MKIIEWMSTKNSDNNHKSVNRIITKDLPINYKSKLKEMNQSNQKEYLSQVFTPLTKEVKERSQVLFQAKPGTFNKSTPY